MSQHCGRVDGLTGGLLSVHHALHRAFERLDVLPQLADHQETAGAQQGLAGGVLVDAQVLFMVDGVVEADQHLAELDLVGKFCGDRIGIQARLGLPVDEAEVVYALGVARHPGQAQRLDAGQSGQQRLQCAAQQGGGSAGSARLRVAGLDPQLQHRVDAVERDPWRSCRALGLRSGQCVRPVQARQLPAPGMIASHIAQPTGPGRHALAKLDRQPRQLRLGQAAGAQALGREGDVDQGLVLRHRIVVGVGDDRGQKRCGRRPVGEGQQAQTAVGDVRVLAHHAALNLAFVERGFACLQRWRHPNRGQRKRDGGLKPQQLAIQLLAASQLDEVADAVRLIDVEQVLEFRQRFLGGAEQHQAVVGVVAVQVRQAVEAGQCLQPLAEQFPGRQVGARGRLQCLGTVGRVDAIDGHAPGDLFGRRDADAGTVQFVGRAAPVAALKHAQVPLVGGGESRRGIEKRGRHLDRPQPAAPFVVAVVPPGLVVHGVAEDQVEQTRRLLPNHPHIGLVGAVEIDRQQNLVVGFARALDHRHPQRMDHAHPFNRVGKGPQQAEFMLALARPLQHPQQRLGTAFVGDRLQCGHQAWLDRRHHQQLGAADKTWRVDFDIAKHALPLRLVANLDND